MGRLRPPATATAAALLATACATVEPVAELTPTEPMASIPTPDWQAGQRREMIDLVSGEPRGYEIERVDADGTLHAATLATGEQKGCRWTVGPDWFSPALSWDGCGTGEWSSGTQSVTRVSGALWPLEPGARATYRRVPISSSGERGTPVTRNCVVGEPVGVVTATGAFDAMKIECKSRRQNGHMETRTWYWNDELREIRYRRTHTRDGLLDDAEAVVSASRHSP